MPVDEHDDAVARNDVAIHARATSQSPRGIDRSAGGARAGYCGGVAGDNHDITSVRPVASRTTAADRGGVGHRHGRAGTCGADRHARHSTHYIIHCITHHTHYTHCITPRTDTGHATAIARCAVANPRTDTDTDTDTGTGTATCIDSDSGTGCRTAPGSDRRTDSCPRPRSCTRNADCVEFSARRPATITDPGIAVRDSAGARQCRPPAIDGSGKHGHIYRSVRHFPSREPQQRCRIIDCQQRRHRHASRNP